MICQEHEDNKPTFPLVFWILIVGLIALLSMTSGCSEADGNARAHNLKNARVISWYSTNMCRIQDKDGTIYILPERVPVGWYVDVNNGYVTDSRPPNTK